jgi:hypothetical protein
MAAADAKYCPETKRYFAMVWIDLPRFSVDLTESEYISWR